MSTKGLRTRQEIVEASLQLFSVKGYYNTSISDILQATGLTKGGLYGHFGSKEEIWDAAYERSVQIWQGIVFEGVREISHPVERVMRAFSLLYRLDIGGLLRETIAFRIDGIGGGEWYVKLSPDAPTSGEGVVEHPNLTIHLRETAVFCQMLTGRFNLPIGLISGKMKLRGDLRLFWRMNTLFSVDAKPKVVTKEKHHPLPST